MRRSIEALTAEAAALRAASSEAMTAYAAALRSPRRPPGRSLEDLHIVALRATQARPSPDCRTPIPNVARLPSAAGRCRLLAGLSAQGLRPRIPRTALLCPG